MAAEAHRLGVGGSGALNLQLRLWEDRATPMELRLWEDCATSMDASLTAPTVASRLLPLRRGRSSERIMMKPVVRFFNPVGHT